MELEYKFIRLKWAKEESIDRALNYHAADGWTLVSHSVVSDELTFVFSRPRKV